MSVLRPAGLPRWGGRAEGPAVLGRSRVRCADLVPCGGPEPGTAQAALVAPRPGSPCLLGTAVLWPCVGTVRHALRTFNGGARQRNTRLPPFSGTRPSQACPGKAPDVRSRPRVPVTARGTHACRPCTLVSPRSPLRSLDRPLGPGGPGLLEGRSPGHRPPQPRPLRVRGVPRLLRLGAVERGRAPVAGSDYT